MAGARLGGTIQHGVADRLRTAKRWSALERRSMDRSWLVLAAAMVGCGSPSTEGVSAPSGMRLVPGAEYRMGTDSSEFEEIVAATGLRDSGPLGPQYPARTVRVEPFYMDTVDVSNADFADFVASHPDWRPSRISADDHNGRYLEHWVDGAPPEELLDHPVTFVTWEAAAAYCAAHGYRLPTEVEYEWAAQGPGGGPYPWGDAPPHDSLVSWGGNGIDGTVPVASYDPNGWGLYDMSGNVWRFLSDPWLGSYAAAAARDPREAAAAERRVVRGGSWGANAANLRVRYRDSHRAFDAREMVGFRCARSEGAF